MTYEFNYKRRFLWYSAIVAGHRYDEAQNKMLLFFANGGIEEIARWRDCSVKLGPDWVLAMKKSMEDKAGQAIPLKVG